MTSPGSLFALKQPALTRRGWPQPQRGQGDGRRPWDTPICAQPHAVLPVSLGTVSAVGTAHVSAAPPMAPEAADLTTEIFQNFLDSHSQSCISLRALPLQSKYGFPVRTQRPSFNLQCTAPGSSKAGQLVTSSPTICCFHGIPNSRAHQRTLKKNIQAPTQTNEIMPGWPWHTRMVLQAPWAILVLGQEPASRSSCFSSSPGPSPTRAPFEWGPFEMITYQLKNYD